MAVSVTLKGARSIWKPALLAPHWVQALTDMSHRNVTSVDITSAWSPLFQKDTVRELPFPFQYCSSLHHSKLLNGGLG
uniref:Uncharacterized protein n=1 Tax=Sphaerodactylus townsendi TaxID=933632 RepID=A0ACB8EM36_9SAUR